MITDYSGQAGKDTTCSWQESDKIEFSSRDTYRRSVYSALFSRNVRLNTQNSEISTSFWKRKKGERRRNKRCDTSRTTLRNTDDGRGKNERGKKRWKSPSTVSNITATTLHLFSTPSLRKIALFVGSCAAILSQADAREFLSMLLPCRARRLKKNLYDT